LLGEKAQTTPAPESARHSGKKVTVEIHLGGDKWVRRRGVTVESNGNYIVSLA
jgi:hypothetical protein